MLAQKLTRRVFYDPNRYILIEHRLSHQLARRVNLSENLGVSRSYGRDASVKTVLGLALTHCCVQYRIYDKKKIYILTHYSISNRLDIKMNTISMARIFCS